MISVGFARVSKKRPCRICGKPSYCGFSRDEGTSICMRISAGSRGLSRNGGNIHVHTEIPFSLTTIGSVSLNNISPLAPSATGTQSKSLFIDLAANGIPRFTDNARFDVTASLNEKWSVLCRPTAERNYCPAGYHHSRYSKW